MMNKQPPAPDVNDGHDLAEALKPQRAAILNQLAQAWRMRAPKSTVLLGAPQRAAEAAESVGTVWFVWLDNVSDLSVVRELAINLVRQGMTYTTASTLAQALATIITELTAGNTPYEVTALKLTRQFSAVFLDQIATQHELRTQQEQEHLAVQLQASAEVGRAAASILDTDQLLREVVNLITDRFGFYYAAVFTLDHTGQYALLREATGQAGEVLKNLNHKLDIHGKSMVGAAITSRQPRVAADVSNEVLRFSNPLLPDTQSEIALPLTVGDRVLGALDVQSTEPHAFDAASVTVLQNMADQIAIAVDNAQLFERVQATLIESQQAQASLARNQAQLAEALKIAKLAYWEYDVEKDLFLFNDQFFSIFHTTAQQHGGYQLSSAYYAQHFVHPDDLAIVGTEIEKALNSTDRHYSRSLEHRILYGDGGIGYITVNINIDRDDQGKIQRYYGANEDITDRKRAEAALQQSEEKFRKMTSAARDSIIMIDDTGAIFFWNEASEKMFGYSVNEALGQALHTLLAPANFMPAFSAAFDNFARYGAGAAVGKTLELEARHRDGHIFPIELSLSAVELENRWNALGIIKDITDRKQTEETLRRNQAQLAEALKIAKLAYWEYDVEKDRFLFNDQFFSIFHTTAQQHGGYQLSSAYYAQHFVHPDDLAIVGTEIEKALNSTDRHYSRSLEHRILYGDGGIGYITVNINIDRDDQGKILRYYGANEDITERKRHEQEVLRFKLGLERATDAVFMTDTAGTIQYVNPAFEKIYGYTPDESVGKTPRILKSGVIPPQQYEHFWQTLLARGVVAGEIINRHKDGRHLVIEGSNNPIIDEADNLIGFLAVHRDVTERKHAETMMQRERGLLRGVIDSVPDLIFYKDLSGQYLGCNVAFEEFAGRSEHELIGRTDHDLFPSDIAEFFREQDAQMLAERSSRRNEEWVTYPNGRRVLLDTLKTPFYDEAGQVLGLIGISRDITARKQADSERERLLARTETLYHTSADLNATHTYTEVLDVLREHTILGEADRNISLNLFDKPWVNDEMPEWCIPLERWTSLPADAVAERYRLRDFAASRLLRADAPIIIADVGADERLDEATRQLYAVRFQAGSTLFVPLVAAGQWIGFLNAVYSEPRAFSEEDIRLLMAATVQAGVVIQSIQRQAEVAESEARFRDVALASADIVWETDALGRYTYCSERIVDVTGFTAAEVIGKEPYEFIMPEDAALVRHAFRQGGLERRPIEDVEVRTRTKDGRTLIMRTNGLPLLDAHGNLSGYRGVLEDITARRQIEIDLARERNLLRTLIDTLPERIFAKDTESRFTLANAAEIQLDGATSFEELRGKNDFDFYPADLAQQYYDAERPIIEEGRSMIGYEERSVDQDGNPRWHISTKVPLRDANQQIIGLVGMTRDITQMKEVEGALAEESNRLRTLIDSLPDLIFIKDRASRFVVNNLAHLRVLGATSQAEVIGKTDFDFFPREIAQQYFTDEQEVMRLGQPLLNREETVLNATTGQAQSANTTKIPLRNVQGEVVGFVGFSQDITERKQAEVELQQRERLLRTIIDATPDWIFIKDQSHRYQLVNQGYADDLHISPDQFIGKDDLELGFPEELVKGNPEKGIAGFWADDRAVMESGQSKVIPNDIVTIDGEQRVFHTIKTPLRDEAAHVWGVLAFGRDVTEREQLLVNQQRRAVQLQTAAEVSRASSSILQLDELLATVVELVRDRFNLYYVGAFLLDDSGQWAVLRAGTGEAGHQMLAAQHRLSVDETSMIGWSIVHQQARIALDVGQDAVRFNNPLLPHTRSEMALPLISRGRVLGAATIQSTQPAAFTTDDVTILQTMADQITTAAENARLFEQTQQTVRLMTAMNEIMSAVVQSTQLSDVYEAAYRSIKQVLPVDVFFFALYDAATRQVSYPLVYELDQHYEQSPQPLEPASRTGRVLLSGEPLLEHLSETEAAAPELYSIGQSTTEEQTRSLVLLPLKIGADTIGVYSVQSYQPNAYTPEHINLLTNVASQMAVAIVNARLFEQTRRAVEDLDALNRRLTGEAWQSYVAARAPGAVIWHASDPNLTQIGENQAEQLAAGVVAVQQLDTDVDISVPIALRGQLIGALRFRAPADKWTAEAQAIATNIAGHLAQAAENTRLLEQTQRTAQREQQIAQAADKIHRASDLQSILQTAVQEIARITGSTDVGIQLGTATTEPPSANGNGHQPAEQAAR